MTLLNLVRAAEPDENGERPWHTVGAGGRDLHRHAHAADAFLRARLRQVTSQRWGVRWALDSRTGAWEITGVPEPLRKVFTKRHGRAGSVRNWPRSI